MATKKMQVRYGRLTQSLQNVTVDVESTVEQFCNRMEISYSNAIRVNGNTVSRQTILHAGDIITNIDNVSGGR